MVYVEQFKIYFPVFIREFQEGYFPELTTENFLVWQAHWMKRDWEKGAFLFVVLFVEIRMKSASWKC
jgi:hypothetical protein